MIIEEFGQASADHQVDQRFERDMRPRRADSLPLTIAILVVAFGALVAAGLPVLLAFSAVLAATGLNALVSHVVPTDQQTLSAIILMIGMAVGIDYSLFYLRREREERRRGRSPHEALLRAARTSGQAVLISGATVLIAMAGMFVSGNSLFTTIGARNDDRRPRGDDRLADGAPRRPVPARRQGRQGPGPASSTRRLRDDGLWGRFIGAVLRRPLDGAAAGGRLPLSCSPCRRSACTRSCRTSPTSRTT